MHQFAALRAVEVLEFEMEAALPVSMQIERFLDGESDGGPLFQALYGAVEDEPVPERLLAIVRKNG
jgi:hypothetical protein